MGENVGENSGAGNNEHDDSCGRYGSFEGSDEPFEVHIFINKHSDDDAVYGRYGSGFGRREDASVNAAEDDNGAQYSPESVSKSLKFFFFSIFC